VIAAVRRWWDARERPAPAAAPRPAVPATPRPAAGERPPSRHGAPFLVALRGEALL
jgi:hypothetical protein